MKRTPTTRFMPKRSDLISLSVVSAHLAFVLAPVFIAAYSGPSLWWLVLWAWCGCFLHGVLNLTHECSHFHVFKNRAPNEIFGRWVLGALLFVGFDRYRQIHWLHHKWIGSSKDPKYSYRIDITGWKLPALFLKSLFLWEAFQKFTYIHGNNIEKEPSAGKKALFRIVVVQSIFVGTLTCVSALNPAHQGWFIPLWAVLAYGLIYMYGLLSLTVFVANLRAIAEHQPFKNLPNYLAEGAALRNLKSNFLTELLFGCYGFSQHATHHLDANVPAYHLPALTKELQGEKPDLVPGPGYFSSLYETTQPLKQETLPKRASNA